MKHLLHPTRARIISSLRGGEQTVNDQMAEVGLTDNAIRSHLETLERQGLVYRSGLRPGTRKPHYAYKLTSDASRIFFEGCEPLLNQLLAVVARGVPRQKFKDILREAGRRLATTEGLSPQRSSHQERIDRALAIFDKLGGKSSIQNENGKL